MRTSRPPPSQQDIALLIELKGTVAGEGKYGFAIIEEKGTRKQRLVKAGDIVAGAKVVRIKRNAVDFLVEDQERTLKIVETKEAPILPPPPGGDGLDRAAPAARCYRHQPERDRGGTPGHGKHAQPGAGPALLQCGGSRRLMISNIRAGSLYQKMGIVDGDIIQEVNNRKIQTADDVMGLLNTMKSGSSLSLTVKRRGNQETLNYQFQ